MKRLFLLTTHEEEWCLAPAKKLGQISNELKVKIEEIKVHKNDVETLKRELKNYQFTEDDVCIIETKYSKLIDCVGEYIKKNTGESKDAIQFDDKKMKLKKKLFLSNIPCAIGTDNFCNAEDLKNCGFELPIFLKPKENEDSVGINGENLCKTWDYVQKYIENHEEDNLMAEEYLSGDEYTVTIVKTKDGYNVFPVLMDVKINNNGDKILGYREKQDFLCELKKITNEKKYQELKDLCIKTFEAIGGKRYARIDMRDDSDGKAKVLEVNLYAGLGEHGYMSDCYKAYGKTYKDMLEDIIGTCYL